VNYDIKLEDADKEKRQQALERAISQIEKQYGKGTIRNWAARRVDVPTISTGHCLGYCARRGGIPHGRVIEIFGRNLQVKPP
jgi:recombination protein RecA